MHHRLHLSEKILLWTGLLLFFMGACMGFVKSGAAFEEEELISNTGSENTRIEGKACDFQWDFISDDSLQKFVDQRYGFFDAGYAPTNTRKPQGKFINTTGKSAPLRLEAADSIEELARAFYERFKTPLRIVSGYRSYREQGRIALVKPKCIANKLCANPWFSEHQSGLAVDLFDASNASEFRSNPKYRAYHEWLAANAHSFGWHQSYQKGVEIDGYAEEPWHWRYIGVGLATRLKNEGKTLTEWVYEAEAAGEDLLPKKCEWAQKS